MGRRWRTLAVGLLTLPAVLTGTVATTAILAPTPAAAAPITLPDLQVLVPTSDISIGTNPDTGHRQLQFTHITSDLGAGPFAFLPKRNATTGISTFVQDIYNNPSPGVWRLDHTVPIAIPGIFDPPSDYRFPLTRFTLNQANPDGTPGALVAVSPKTDYCITADTYVGGVPHTPAKTSPPQSNCTNPNRLLGFSVGWGDEYDQTDNGQPIDLTGIPDGTYVLHAIVDPQHVFQESNVTNDVVDTELQIAGNSVTVLGQTTPPTTPPTVAVTSPAAGASVQGTVTLESDPAATAPASVASVQYLLDGEPLGAPVTTAPYDYSWTVGITPTGPHNLSAQVTDTDGNVGTAPVDPVTVVPNSSGGLGLDASTTKTGSGSISTGYFSTTQAGDTLVAFVGADGPSGVGTQTITVTGPTGITWHKVALANTQSGAAAIYTATAPSVLTNARVTSHEAKAPYAQQITVMAFSGAQGVGASSTASGPSGAPSTTLTADAAGSLTYAVGSDWDQAIARSLNSDQSMVQQWVDTTAGDTFWLQGSLAPTTAAGQSVTLGDTGPTTDQWDLAAVEVLAAPPPAPSVVVTDPAKGETLSGTTPLAAVPRDTAGVRRVQFMLDGRLVGQGTPGSRYSVHWDSAKVADGPHLLESVATDAAGRTVSDTVPVTVANPAPPMTCFVLSARAHAFGRGTVTTSAIHTAAGGEQLVAFVAARGTTANTKVRGAGLAWHLVTQTGTNATRVAVWAAEPTRVMTDVRVTSVLRSGTQELTVMAMEGTGDPSPLSPASGVGGAPTNPSLTTTEPTSLVFVVGTGTPGSVAVPAGWSRLSDDSARSGSYFVDYTNQPASSAGTNVTFTAPGGDASWGEAPWGLAAAQLPGDGD